MSKGGRRGTHEMCEVTVAKTIGTIEIASNMWFTALFLPKHVVHPRDRRFTHKWCEVTVSAAFDSIDLVWAVLARFESSRSTMAA